MNVQQHPANSEPSKPAKVGRLKSGLPKVWPVQRVFAARDWSRDFVCFDTSKIFTEQFFLSNWLTLVLFFLTIFFVTSECYVFNNASTSMLQNSKFAFRQPLHKLRCNYFRFFISIFIAAQFAFRKRRVTAELILYFSFKMCLLVQLLENRRWVG